MAMGRDRWRAVAAGVLALAAAVAWSRADFFGHELLAQIAILAIFAMSLDLLVGYAGLVSLGHAAFYGIGAYATALFTALWGGSAWLAMPFSVVVAAAAALLVGAFAVRLAGVFFIMITLAIGQMTYAYFFKSAAFGGDDGLAGIARIDLGWIGLNANEPAHFALFALVVAGLVYLALDRVTRAPFGRMLVAIHDNESRLRALGCPVYRYKVAVFTLAGAVAGLAGSLAAQHAMFISPELLTWTTSGEALIVVIVGGMGSLIGPAAGAAIVILLADYLSGETEYWMFFMGAFFVAVVLLAGDGLYGALRQLGRWRGAAGRRAQ